MEPTLAQTPDSSTFPGAGPGSGEYWDREAWSASLDTLQTSVGSAEWRGQVRAELDSQGERVDRWDSCGSAVPFLCGWCGGGKRVGRYHCNHPLCNVCARRRAAKLVDEWSDAASRVPQQGGFRWRFMTLTLLVGSTQRRLFGELDELGADALTETIAADRGRLLASSRKLRDRLRRRYGKGIGFFYTVEVGSESSGRNVHLHVLYYGPWLDQKWLSSTWLACTGDSRVVWISLVKGGLRRGVRETCKYITKLDEHEPRELVAIFRAFKGKPHGRAAGACHGLVRAIELAPLECDVCGQAHWVTEEWLGWQERAARAPP